MTIEQAKRIYIAAGGPDDHCESEWSDIHKEMEDVVAAKTDHSAANVIRWWDCWGRNYTAIAFARRVRKQNELDQDQRHGSSVRRD